MAGLSDELGASKPSRAHSALTTLQKGVLELSVTTDGNASDAEEVDDAAFDSFTRERCQKQQGNTLDAHTESNIRIPSPLQSDIADLGPNNDLPLGTSPEDSLSHYVNQTGSGFINDINLENAFRRLSSSSSRNSDQLRKSNNPFDDFNSGTSSNGDQAVFESFGDDDPFSDFSANQNGADAGFGGDEWGDFGQAGQDTLEAGDISQLPATSFWKDSHAAALLRQRVVDGARLVEAAARDVTDGFPRDKEPIQRATPQRSAIPPLSDRASASVGAQLFLGADGEVQSVALRRRGLQVHQSMLTLAVGATEDLGHRRNTPKPGDPPLLQQLFMKEMALDDTPKAANRNSQRISKLLNDEAAEEARILLEKLEQMEQALEEEQRELESQKRIIEIEHREAALYPDLEEEVLSSNAAQGLEDRFTREMKEKGGLEQRTQAGTKLITHQQLPPPMNLNSFFRSPSNGNTPAQSPHATAMSKASPAHPMNQSPTASSLSPSRPIETSNPNDGPMTF